MTTTEIVTALEGVQKMTGAGGSAAETVLEMVGAAVAVIIGGAKGEVDSGAVLAEIATLQARIDANDTAADAKLAGKFPTG